MEWRRPALAVDFDCTYRAATRQRKKAPLGESCLDESRSGKRRGEEPQSQENALTAWLRRAKIALHTDAFGSSSGPKATIGRLRSGKKVESRSV